MLDDECLGDHPIHKGLHLCARNMSESEFSPVWQRVDRVHFRNPTNLSPQKYREKCDLFYQQYFNE